MIAKDARIFIAGHRGMVGSAILRCFEKNGYRNLLTRTHEELDLRNESEVKAFYDAEKPEYVVIAAAKVGGIAANDRFKAEFLLENLQIQNNLIWQAYLHQVKKLCFLGSSCIYPCEAPQPIREEYLLTGPLEPTNEGYALAKIAGYKLCVYLSQQYGFHTVSAMPCNLYGRNDHFDLERCHVLPALIRRFCDAVAEGRQEVVCWGPGTPLREFLNVDDMASAVYFLFMNHDDPQIVNVGSSEEISIRELAELVARLAGFQGRILWDRTKPDGMKRKLMDSSKIRSLGWKPVISLEDGIAAQIEEYRSRVSGR